MVNNTDTESAYLSKLINGDESAFRYFIKTYQDMAFTLAVSIVKDDFVAEEIAQDAFVKAFRAIKSFNRQSAFKTWFYRIVVNEAFAWLKKSKRNIIQYGDDYETNVADEDTGDLNDNEKLEMVNEAFKLMPPNEALVLRLFYLEEESIKEVGAITGWTEANIKVLLHRARKRMLAIVQQQKKICL